MHSNESFRKPQTCAKSGNDVDKNSSRCLYILKSLPGTCVKSADVTVFMSICYGLMGDLVSGKLLWVKVWLMKLELL